MEGKKDHVAAGSEVVFSTAGYRHLWRQSRHGGHRLLPLRDFEIGAV